MEIVPAPGATGVNTTTTVQIKFSGAVNPTTVSATNIQVTDPSKKPVAGTISYNATSNTATFTPSAALGSNATFTVTVTAVASSSGTAMAQPFRASFTTGPSGATTQYQAPLFPAGPQNGSGQVSLDVTGTVTVRLTGATQNTTFTVQFCPAYALDFLTYNCFDVGNLASDSSGNANVTMAFPQSGSWAGDFQLISGGTTAYQTNGGFSSQVYMSILQAATTVNGKGIGYPFPSQDPLSSGSVILSNGTLQFTLTGAFANTIYSAGQCIQLGSSSCYQLYNGQGTSGFTTDGNGNLTFSVLPDGYAGDMFQVFSSTGAGGFIGGFVVPSGS